MLRKKRLQNKIATSRFSLPITATLAALAWVAVGFMVGNIWVQFAFTIISTLLMVELNNRNALMRTYSRMVSCSFLTLITMAALPSPSLKASIVVMCFIAFYLIIWNAYQDRQASGWSFYAFFCIGLASTVFIQVIYYVPFLWLMLIAFTNCFSIRTFMASVIGLMTPYWFSVGYYVYTDKMDAFVDHFIEFINYQELFDYSTITDHQVINFGFIILLSIIGIVHFMRTSYADKIRTRMIYESLIMLNIVTMIFIVLQPQHDLELGGILIVNTAPLIAHFITFTRGKVTNVVFIALLAIAAFILAFNILVPPITLL